MTPAKKDSPAVQEKSTATPTVQPDIPAGFNSMDYPAQQAAPNPPPGPYALGRTITVTIYTAAGKPPIYYLNDGTFYHYNSSEQGLLMQLKNQLHPPYPALGPSLPWG